jgi:2-deoxy-D-gluconate 3-dehydrogenase
MGAGDPFRLDGQTAVITGASRGIGEAIALGLVAAGADVVTMQRSEPSARLSSAAQDAGARLTHVPVDFTRQEAIADAVGATLDSSPVDILVNNAGTQIRHDATQFPLEDLDTVMDVNLKAVFQLCQGFAPGMLSRGRGKIINLASLLSFQGGSRVAAYAASKGAVAQLTKALANEWAERGVNVNAIAPGYFATEMNTALLEDERRNEQISARIPAGRWGQAADISGAAVFLASSAADYVHGVVLPVDGGWLGR